MRKPEYDRVDWAGFFKAALTGVIASGVHDKPKAVIAAMEGADAAADLMIQRLDERDGSSPPIDAKAGEMLERTTKARRNG